MSGGKARLALSTAVIATALTVVGLAIGTQYAAWRLSYEPALSRPLRANREAYKGSTC